MMSSVYEMHYIRANGVLLHTVIAGPADGEPIMLLHGFPEYWYGWRAQIDVLAAAGYRVIVPDQRGYNLSDKPKEVSDYRISILATDVVSLAEALGYTQINLVGHDWGAAVAWWVATMYPERLKKLVILNVPYPSLMRDELLSGNWQQIMKSWYIGFFQIPFLSEGVLSFNNYEGLADTLRRTSNPGSFTEADIERYKRAWAMPGAMTAMLNWYRAMVQQNLPRIGGGSPSSSGERPPARIRVPTLMLWGEKDVALSKELAQPSIDMCDDGRLIFFPNATHWVQHDEAEAVNRHILEFVSS